jgi:hypothetical protein
MFAVIFQADAASIGGRVIKAIFYLTEADQGVGFFIP